jgi:hypothetical protein
MLTEARRCILALAAGSYRSSVQVFRVAVADRAAAEAHFSRDFGLSQEAERQLLENVRARKASRQAQSDGARMHAPTPSGEK